MWVMLPRSVRNIAPKTDPAAGVGAALPILNQQTEPPRRTHYCVQSAITANSMFKPSPAYSLHTAINPNQQPGLFSKSLPGRTQWKSWLNPSQPVAEGRGLVFRLTSGCLVFQNTLPLWLSSPAPIHKHNVCVPSRGEFLQLSSSIYFLSCFLSPSAYISLPPSSQSFSRSAAQAFFPVPCSFSEQQGCQT